MPINYSTLEPEVKRNLLQSRGYDPNKYRISDDGFIEEMQQGQPTMPADQGASTLKLGNANTIPALTSFGRAAAESTIPATTGLLGAAAGAALAPASGGLSLLLPLLGALGGAAAGSYGQSKLVPEATKQQLFSRPEDIEQHPIASFAGGLAPQAIGFNPVTSLRNIPALGRGLTKLPSVARTASLAPLETAEQQALLNAGINAAVGGGQEAYDVLAHDKPFSPGHLAASVIAPTLLFTEPTAIGRGLGFHPTTRLPQYVHPGAPDVVEQPPTPLPNAATPQQFGTSRGGALFTPEGAMTEAGVPVSTQNLAGELTTQLTGEASNPSRPFKSAIESAAVIDPEGVLYTEKQRDFFAAKAQEERQNLAELQRQEYESLKAEREAKAHQLTMRLGQHGTAEAIAGRGVARPEQIPAPTERLAETHEEFAQAGYPDYTVRQKIQQMKLGEQPAETQAEYEQRLYEEGKRRAGESALGGKAGTTPIESLPPDVQEKLRRLEDIEARQRGIAIQRGVPLKGGVGQYDIGTRTTRLAPKAAGDIAGHEVIGHGYLRDMLQSASPADRKLAMEGINKWSGHEDVKTAEDYLKLPDAEQAKLEEEFAKQLGVDSFNRKKLELYGNKRQRFADWWRDTRASLKTKFGIANPEELVTAFGARGKYEAPYGTRAELLSKGTTAATGVRHAAEEEDPYAYTPEEQEQVARGFKLNKQAPDYVPYEMFKEGFVLGESALRAKGMNNYYEIYYEIGKRHEQKFYATARNKQLKEDWHEYVNSSDFEEYFNENYTIASSLNRAEELTTERKYLVEDLGQSGGELRSYFRSGNNQGVLVDFLRHYPEHALDDSGLQVGKTPTYYESRMQTVAQDVADMDFSGNDYAEGMETPDVFKIAEQWPYFRRTVYDQNPAVANWIDHTLRTASDSPKKGYEGPSELPHGLRFSQQSALGTPAKEPLESTVGRRSFIPALTSRIDKVAETVAHKPTGEYVTQQFHKWQSDADRLEGQIGNRLIATAKGYDLETIQRVDKYRHALSIGEDAPYQLNATEMELKDKMDAAYKKIAGIYKDAGMRIQLGEGKSRERIIKDVYRNSTLSNKVADAWARGNEDAKRYDEMFMKHATTTGELSAADAKELLDDYKQAIGHAGITPDIRFGALRKVEGIGLPWEMVDQNFMSAARRYGARAAADLSFYKHVQSDTKMLKALGIPNQEGKRFNALTPEEQSAASDVEYVGNNPAVKQAERSIYGVVIPPNPRIQSFIRSIGSAIMQTGTAVRNLAQMPVTIAPYYGVNVDTIFKAASRMNDRAGAAFENNAIRSSFKDFDAAGDYEGNPDKFVNLADKFVGFMRKWTGRDLSDKLEGLFHYSLGEELATKWFAQAKAGDVKARAMINRFGITLEKPAKSYFETKAPVSADDVARIAKEFVNAARGSYSASGLPSVAIEGNVAPFLALSRWNIERSNVFWRDVVQPLREQGDWMPLLKTTFAGIMTGAGIEQLNELLSGKRGADPTVKETLAQLTPENALAKAIGLAQLGSLAGIVSDAAKVGMNLYQGKSSKFANPVSLPAATVAEDLYTSTTQMHQAIREGEDPFEVLGEYMKDFVTHTFQNARYANAATIGKEEAGRKENLRDLRVFEELTDRREPSTDIGQPNPYTGLAQKKFKRTDDISEAVSLLPRLVEQASDNSRDADGQLDIERFRKKLRALKLNNYETLPDILRNPRAFRDYLEHLTTTQGEEQTQRRVSDYFSQKVVNKIKSSLVPSL